MPPSIIAKTKVNKQTMITAPSNSSLPGQVTFLSSDRTSLIKEIILLIVTNFLQCGRSGGIRTPNTRIWSPLLYQLELLTQPFYLITLLPYVRYIFLT